MITAGMRRNAARWFKEEFNRHYKGKFSATDDAIVADESGSGQRRRVKRHKASTAEFFADSDDSGNSEEELQAAVDEVTKYLDLPQIKYKTEWDAIDWWKEHSSEFPNLAVMARQYLGCPATSATVERLFSKVGIAFAAKRKSSDAKTLEDIAFAQLNLP